MKINYIYKEKSDVVGEIKISQHTVRADKNDFGLYVEVQNETEKTEPQCFQLINPTFHEHLPTQLMHMGVTHLLKEIDLSMLQIIDLDYPELEYKFDHELGRLVKILSDQEKDAQAQMGGSQVTTPNYEEEITQ